MTPVHASATPRGEKPIPARPATAEKESPRLQSLRDAAWRTFVEAPLPSRTTHLWRYSDPEKFLPAPSLRPLAPSVRVEIPHEAKKAGVIAGTIEDALEREETKNLFGSLAGADFGKFEALNLALFRDGVFLYVPRGVSLVEPIRIARAVGGETSDFLAARTLVVAGENSEATLIEEFVGQNNTEGEFPQLNAVTEIFLRPAARLRRVLAETLPSHVQAFLTSRARVARGAHFTEVAAAFGGAMLKADVGAVLEGEGAELDFIGVAWARGKQRFDLHTLARHDAPRTRSRLDYRVALRDRARSAYTGLIGISPGAPHSEAYQENRNLLLSSSARAETIPELEIMTDEVRCSHGATVAPLDPLHIFYLQSRGIPREEAVRMAARGFFEPALARVPESLRETLERWVEERWEKT